MTKYLVGVVALCVLSGCGDVGTGTLDGSVTDSGTKGDSGTVVVDSGTVVVDAGAGTVDAGTAATCSAYCTAITANCTGAEKLQYPNAASCNGACAGFAQGTIGEQSGNNLECRAYHAGAAAADPTLHCPHAGPSGDGACGMDCDGFCAIQAAACTAGNQQYATIDACKTECAAFAHLDVRYNASTISGNSFACRMYHLSVAATAGGASATTHCPHIKANGAPCQ